MFDSQGNHDHHNHNQNQEKHEHQENHEQAHQNQVVAQSPSGPAGQTLAGTGGDDTLTGGAGDDVFRVGPGAGSDTITDFGTGTNRLEFTGGLFPNLEAVRASAHETEDGDLRIRLSFTETLTLEDTSLDDLTTETVTTVDLLGGDSTSSTASSYFFFDPDGTPTGSQNSGSEGDDLVEVQGTGNDLIRGLGGDDRLVGHAGDDRLDGGAGDDTLIGGDGDDVFRFGPGAGSDTITDFGTGTNRLEFTDGLFANLEAVRAAATEVGGNLEIELSDTDTLTLAGVSLAALTADTVITLNEDGVNTTNRPGSVAISGMVTEDEELTATATDANGLPDAADITYQWQRSDDQGNFANIANATAQTYTLGDADVGRTVRVQVSYTDGQGTAESVTSAATTAVTNTNDDPTGAVTISGTVTEGETLTADISALRDADGLPADAAGYSYQWQRSDGSGGFDDIPNANQSTYTLGDADVGQTVRVQVRYTDGQGTVETVTSDASAAVTNTNDLPTGSVAISGSVSEGEMLTADTAGLADDDGLGAFSYQWQRNTGANGGFENIANATARTYTLGDDDAGQTVRVQVRYTDGQGTAESVTSDATAEVTNTNDMPTGEVTISGTVTEGETLTADISALRDADGLPADAAGYDYQWQRNTGANGGFENIAGATQFTYTLGDADVGRTVQVQVSYTDGQGTDESVTSEVTAAVENANVEGTGGAQQGGGVEPGDGDVSPPDSGNQNIDGGAQQGGGAEPGDAGGVDTTQPPVDPNTNTDGTGSGAVTPPTPPPAPPVTGPSTGAGTVGNDVLTGSAGEDFLRGLAGNDQLTGGAGGDRLFGGAGRDNALYRDSGAGVMIDLESGTASGGDAAGDTLVAIEDLTGSAFDDTLSGNAQANGLSGGSGDDRLNGAGGADLLLGGLGNDVLDGGSGRDALSGDEGDDTLEGGAGVDALLGGPGNDVLRGGDDTDRLFGGAGNTMLSGDGGADVLYGGVGDDTLSGGEGADVLNGLSGSNVLTGGAGSDVFVFFGDRAETRVTDFNPSEDRLSVLAGDAEGLTTGNDEAGHLVIEVGETRATLEGVSAIDEISIDYRLESPLQDAAEVNESVDEDGNLVLEVVDTSVVLEGLSSLAGITIGYQQGDADHEVLVGSAGHDVLYGGGGNDVLSGGLSGDLVIGGSGHDVVYGGAAGDLLLGESGDDLLFGEGGADVIRGGAGSDILVGGDGDNVLQGGAGEDMFVVDVGAVGNERIVDFNLLEDSLVFLGLEPADRGLEGTAVEGGTLLTLSDEHTLLVVGVNPEDLGRMDVVFF